MRKYILFFALLPVVFASCDDGRIYEKTMDAPQEGLTLKMKGHISGIGKWPDMYSVVVAGFNENSEYAVVAKTIPAPAAEGDEIEVFMSGITDEVATVELCVINKLRKRIVSFARMDEVSAVSDTILMDAGTVNVGMYTTIQTQIFNSSCIGCHGKSTSAAANLFLTEGKSYNALVNQPSAIDKDKLLVKPGSAKESFLNIVLNTNGNTSHDHLDILSGKPVLLTLIDDWIEEGAQQ